MKSIALIANTGRKKQYVAQHIRNNLREVLGDEVSIQTYYISDFTSRTIIDHDVILVLDYNRLPEIQQYIPHLENIIFAERTFLKENVAPLYDIPEGMQVLVVNDTWSSTLETVEHLYQATGGYLQFVPYQPGKQYPEITVAVTPGEAETVPPAIRRIYDIENRCLNVYTFWQILNRLELSDKRAKQRLLSYAEKTVDITSSVNKQYRELFIKNEVIESVTKKLNEGIIITDCRYRVVYYNEKVSSLLPGISQETDLRKLFRDNGVQLPLDRRISEELVRLRGATVLVSKSEISHPEGEAYCYFDLKEDVYIKNLGNSLSQELKKKGLVARYCFEDIFYRSKAMEAVIKYGQKIADTDFSVLITGETGTGKELIAQAMHNASKRRLGPFVAVNCAALPESLLESELFGYEKGAFTGASVKGKIGLFEQANGGTIFLDEIGDMPLLLQTRLLRVLQEKQVMRVGGDRFVNIDVRVLAATNQNLNELVEQQRFRRDLLYRINVFQLQLPALRERREDILPLLSHFTDGLSDSLEPGYQEMLKDYPFPGNIRELQSTANYVRIMCNDIPDYIKKNIPARKPLRTETLSEQEVESLLRIVRTYQIRNETVGREKIRLAMKEEGFRIGDYRIEAGMSELQSLGYLRISRGRLGTLLTSQGMLYLGDN
ncbi:MAG TPA: sigma 54-interacting transcriptional regulator [Clostridia bacterium]|nr:sigma 54-interacting transcriptional regulator [Clostridia bacterium]